MKKIVFASAAILGVSLSLVYANNDAAFLESIERRLFAEDVLSPMEKGKLLALSTESLETVKAKTTLVKRARRNYRHITLKPRKPFYTKQIRRVVDEPSIDIVKRKDRVSREKALRYRNLFSY